MTKEKTKIVMIVLACLVVLSFLFTTQSKADVETEKEKFNYHLMVPLPTASGTVTEVEGITDYIKTIYLFAMGIAGVLAMALIVVGGFQWLTATGNTGTISQAKARINNALLGLVVLLSAYLLLNTINPALVNLKEPVLLFLDWTEEFGNAGGGGPGGGGRPAYCDDKGITTCLEYAGNLIDCGFGTPVCTAGQCVCVHVAGGVDFSLAESACNGDTCDVSDGPCEFYRSGLSWFNCHPQ